ncbi:ABC transporter permease [Silicimonas algicola]|uniref:Peptide/nickel transport system permease protein n=1 Tax=Silicimonas algicola TaxID=1826607 RepID=A0A316FY19_9RHOB|nr:ABC transporter permease [Silicimonas algicola]AZQ68424.1 ABC transporter permease [Silicimonas algicola]PWK53489.1 peptide/nickel transport system permease protein [Silicimonas algicola]
MARYLLLRLLDLVPTVFLVLTLVFIAMRILPGDPALAALGANADGGQLEAFRERMGLNDPLWLQYVHFLWDAVRLDFGNSLMSNIPISTLIANNLPHTVYLTIVSVALGLFIGIPLGLYAATQRNKLPDNALRIYSLIGYSVPDFYLGAILLIVFSLNLGWFPINGAGEGFWDGLHHIFLPALSLALLKSAFLGRLTRTSLLEVLGRDYVRTARAKGAREGRVIFRHGLRNAMLPLSTGIGISILATLSGAVAIELVFNRPGIGRLLISAIQERDYPVIQAGVMMFATFVVLVNLLMDIVYIFIDPRIRMKS